MTPGSLPTKQVRGGRGRGRGGGCRPRVDGGRLRCSPFPGGLAQGLVAELSASFKDAEADDPVTPAASGSRQPSPELLAILDEVENAALNSSDEVVCANVRRAGKRHIPAESASEQLQFWPGAAVFPSLRPASLFPPPSPSCH